VVLAKQWIGSAAAPLRPGAILAEVAKLCKAYRVSVLDSDQYYGDALRDLAAQQKLVLIVHAWNEREKLAKFLALKTMFEQGMVEIPSDQVLRTDLSRIKKVLKGNGASISFPRTADGRHCDYAPCLAMELGRYWQTEEEAQEAAGEVQRMSEEEQKILKRIIDKGKPKDEWGYSW
jgi:phage FluMu gp28-like protein